MELILDQELCIRCGRCTGVCPAQIIAKKKDGAILVVRRAFSRCIQCGQCVACCPRGALTLNGIQIDTLQQIQDAPLSEIQRDMLFKARRSVRMYREEPVEHEILFSALEDARYAPTASNAQEVEWLLVEGRDKLRDIGARVANWARQVPGPYAKIAESFDAGHDPIFRNAPALILAHGDTTLLSVIDCTAAVSYLELALHSRGIGTCWAGYLIAAAFNGTDLGLPLPEGRKLCAGLMFGHPAMRFHRLPPRKPVRLIMT